MEIFLLCFYYYVHNWKNLTHVDTENFSLHFFFCKQTIYSLFIISEEAKSVLDNHNL